MSKTILLIGASGLMGREVLDLLLEDSRCKSVIALVRKPIPVNHAKLTQLPIVFEKISAVTLPSNIDTVMLCLGSTIAKAGSKEDFEKIDRSYNFESAKLAQKYGAKTCVLISAVGADPNSNIFYSKVKGLLEEDLKTLNFEGLYFLQPGLLLGDRQENRTMESISQVLFGKWTQKVGIFGKYTSIHVEQLAKVMVELGLRPYSNEQAVLQFKEMKKLF